MFAMSQHHYGYPSPVPPPRPYSASHGTSSAFSSSANPDEDWTKISDLAERRRIQNRIAQRNYRKKLKRRLEDLERRAGDGSEKQVQPATPAKSSNAKRQSSAPKPQKPAAPKAALPQQGQFTPPMQHDDDMLFPPTYDGRERSRTPPSLFSYSTYPPPDEQLLMTPYGSTQSYPGMTTAEAYPAYLATTIPPVSLSLPAISHFSDAIKRDPYAAEDGMPGYVNYGLIPGIDVNSPPQYDQHSNPHTPPLSHSFDHSANGSESEYNYPTTPLSMPGSPSMMQN